MSEAQGYSRKYKLGWGGKVMEAEREARGLQPMVIRCFCGVVFDGIAQAVIKESAAHRDKHHPELKLKREAQRKLLRKSRGKVRY